MSQQLLKSSLWFSVFSYLSLFLPSHPFNSICLVPISLSFLFSYNVSSFPLIYLLFCPTLFRLFIFLSHILPLLFLFSLYLPLKYFFFLFFSFFLPSHFLSFPIILYSLFFFFFLLSIFCSLSFSLSFILVLFITSSVSKYLSCIMRSLKTLTHSIPLV